MTYENMTMVSCSNPYSVGRQAVGTTASLQIGNIFLFNGIYSSTIQSVTTDDNGIITIQTLNTNYVFKPASKD